VPSRNPENTLGFGLLKKNGIMCGVCFEGKEKEDMAGTEKVGKAK
jgi:hypothetical protein